MHLGFIWLGQTQGPQTLGPCMSAPQRFENVALNSDTDINIYITQHFDIKYFTYSINDCKVQTDQ